MATSVLFQRPCLHTRRRTLAKHHLTPIMEKRTLQFCFKQFELGKVLFERGKYLLIADFSDWHYLCTQQFSLLMPNKKYQHHLSQQINISPKAAAQFIKAMIFLVYRLNQMIGWFVCGSCQIPARWQAGRMVWATRGSSRQYRLLPSICPRVANLKLYEIFVLYSYH